ncbi:MAG: hypothetical protein HY796_05790 [Elusimicrobia bacterium]|nr:hypothetical protein [Elusimicrobiota bacterium]
MTKVLSVIYPVKNPPRPRGTAATARVEKGDVPAVLNSFVGEPQRGLDVPVVRGFQSAGAGELMGRMPAPARIAD